MLWDTGLWGCRAAGCKIRELREVSCRDMGYRDASCGAVGSKAVGYGAGIWMWEYGAVGCEDAGLHVHKKQGNGAAGCRAVGYTAVGGGIWEFGAAGCGIHDCRMRDVGTREAGYG